MALLTKVQREILHNQYHILSLLEPDMKADYELKMKIVANGYTAFYEDIYEGYSDEISPEVCAFVFSVLDMYRTIYFAYQGLDDKSGVPEKYVSFQGFDGNSEPAYYLFAYFCLRDAHRFEEFGPAAVSSYSQMVDKYKRMLPVYDGIKKNKAYEEEFTKEDILAVINA